MSTRRARPGRLPRTFGAVPPTTRAGAQTPRGQQRASCALRLRVPRDPALHRRMLTTGQPARRTVGSPGARTRVIGCGSSPVGCWPWPDDRPRIRSDLALSLATLTAAVADLRAAQHLAAPAAAPRRAAKQLREAVTNHGHRPGTGACARLRCSPHGFSGRTHGGPAGLSGAQHAAPPTPTQVRRAPG
jgi:hypothetical protein